MMSMLDSTSLAQGTQTRPTSAIELRAVSKQFRTPTGGLYTALRDLSLSIQPGEFCALVGPTGSGKSTTLSLISGLERASRGDVSVMGTLVAGVNPHVGFVFQNDTVFPWRTLLANVMSVMLLLAA